MTAAKLPSGILVRRGRRGSCGCTDLLRLFVRQDSRAGSTFKIRLDVCPFPETLAADHLGGREVSLLNPCLDGALATAQVCGERFNVLPRRDALRHWRPRS